MAKQRSPLVAVTANISISPGVPEAAIQRQGDRDTLGLRPARVVRFGLDEFEVVAYGNDQTIRAVGERDFVGVVLLRGDALDQRTAVGGREVPAGEGDLGSRFFFRAPGGEGVIEPGAGGNGGSVNVLTPASYLEIEDLQREAAGGGGCR